MTFTDKEVAALEKLKEVFGPVREVNPLHVETVFADSYKENVRNYLSYALLHLESYKLAIDPELPTIKTRLLEEKRKAEMEKNANRAIEKRESLVLSYLSGLLPMARRAGDVSFETDDSIFSLVVQGDKNEILALEYDRADGFIRGHLLGDDFEDEDWTVLNGNSRPADQSGAYAAVSDYLASLVPNA